VVTILLIADQDRLEKLFDFVGDSPQIRFRVSRSLRQGIQDISEEPPVILFVQNHLSGLSGEIIARHLIEQAEGTKPKVVLFGDPGSSPACQAPIDACLDISRTNEDLTADIIGIIAETSQQQAASEPLPAMQPDETVEPAGEEAPVQATTEPPIPATDAVNDIYSREQSSAPSQAEATFDQKLKTVIQQSPEPVPLAEMEDTVSLSETSTGRAPAGRRRQSGKAPAKDIKPRLWIGLAAVAVVAIGTTVMLLSRSGAPPASSPKPPAPKAIQQSIKNADTPPSPAPVAAPASTAAQQQPSRDSNPVQAPPEAKRGLDRLPGFIPKEGHDRSYGKDHPGWERYKGARTEFKVYSDGTAIRAVQAIDRSGVGIPESFLSGALNQMTNSRDFTIEAKETQGKFRVEKGTASGGARLVVYRTVPKGSIRAFVVHFN
jgi:hypothetical protein